MSTDQTVNAAGCVVYRRANKVVEVLLVHRPNYDDWSFPKGKRDEGETDYECALRETLEESGYGVDPAGELTSMAYTLPNGKPKKVRFWYGEVGEGKFKANSEVDEIKWLGIGKARDLLSYDRDKELLDEFSALVN